MSPRSKIVALTQNTEVGFSGKFFTLTFFFTFNVEVTGAHARRPERKCPAYWASC